MTISFTTARRLPTNAAVVAYGIKSDELGNLPACFSSTELKKLGFKGELGQVQILPEGNKLIAAVGLGESTEISPTKLRTAAAALARAARRHASVATDLVSKSEIETTQAIQSVVEGMALSLYKFDYKSSSTKNKEDEVLKKVVLAGSTSSAANSAILKATAVVEGVVLARDLVNEPGGSLTPQVFARKATRMAKEKGLTAKVMDEAAIKKAGFGGLLGVNRGSDHPPRFVELTYRPKGKAKATLALVGKGITFDSGGLSIKPWQGMSEMKTDMGGAAAVIGAMSALSSLAPKIRVKGYLPMTDNMLGGDATRPGDVLKIRNGKTIEVINTDAEGRLILADALSLASEANPDAIVDLATLTGACVVALGSDIAGLMGKNDAFLNQVEKAAKDAGEKVWQLPLPDEYKDLYKSPIADMKNISAGGYGGALTAGLILSEFVPEGIPWAHLDIAGPARADKDNAENVEGGTGFGVRTLIKLIQSFEPPESE
ncbi:MAG: leucyl aminopeptidase [Acidimicrobiales bacterium]|nr:leucyl aminopeptidase [Acidimicrobiales bacterium]|tara:strand:+ start:3795 stop:5258 length:1464 start_codon:yes stop_codon:yes gene_type:complete